MPLVVIIGTAHWSRRWLAEHQVARRLTRYADVLFVDPALSSLTVRRHRELAPLLDRESRPLEVATGVYTILPRVLPGKDRRGISRLVDYQVRVAVRRACRHLGRRPVATISALPGRDLLAQAPGIRIYWAKDDHRAGAALYGQDGSRLGRAEDHLASSADHLVVCSPALAASWLNRGHLATVIPNGCDVEHFASGRNKPRPTDLPTAGPFAIYVGTLTDRIDTQLLEATADAGVDVVMVGGQRRTQAWEGYERLQAHPRVHMMGKRDYESLPAYLGAATVGLIPYRVDAYNQGSFPLKLFEYLAAGLPVVSTPLAAVESVRSPHVHITDGAANFAILVHHALFDHGANIAEECLQIASANSWTDRAHQFATLIGMTKRPAK